MVTTYLTNEGEPKIKYTVEGGLAIRLINKTGSASVKGQLVSPSAGTDNAFDTSIASDTEMIGIVYEAGVADGSLCWIVVVGIAEVLLKDTTAATRANWVSSSSTAGRADATAASPPGADPSHFQEIGHALESKSGGTDVLCKVKVHFN
jgi:hypothetical protein